MENKFVDYYELLQVHPKADNDVIKKAYYTLMQKNHPDKGGSEEVTKKINEAYNVLISPELRKKHDQERSHRLLKKIDNLTKNQPDKKDEQKNKKNKSFSLISKNCPVLANNGVLVADERGNRILIIDSEGQINWEFGGLVINNQTKLKSPKSAFFTSNNNILVSDNGNSRVIELNSKKEIVWQYGTGVSGGGEGMLNNPLMATKTENGNYLICDSGNKRVIEVNSFGNIIWQYGETKDNKIFGKSFLPLINKNNNLLFYPTFSQRLENGNTLIIDNGNKRIIEVSSDKKIINQFPAKKNIFNFAGANFCSKSLGGKLLFTLDKVYEVDQSGNLIWQYSKNTSDIDINWAYRLEKEQLLINITRIIRRGINQEVMLIDGNNRVIWRYYYSQYKYL